LQRRSALRLLINLLFFAFLLFLPAGSLRFWHAWMLLGLMSVLWTFFLIDLLRHSPQLIERRLEGREAEPEQRTFQKLFLVILVLALIAAGLDFRLGWSRSLRSIPLWLILAGQAVSVAAYSFVFWVMKTNTFAGSTIRVEEKQRVIDIGPYAIVRHPMYLGMAMLALGMPIALASCVALPIFALIIPVLVYRLIHEERTLRRSLAGYEEYCQRLRFRLLPWVW
jgi:protein-S-isoprenylcysteine O-methyltransferase Ste14